MPVRPGRARGTASQLIRAVLDGPSHGAAVRLPLPAAALSSEALGVPMGKAGGWRWGIVGVLLAAVAATGAERGTPSEAQAMLGKAIAHYKAVGRQQALADFNKKAAPFVDRDLYVVCLAPDHTILANGGFPSLVGSSADALKDADGKALGKSLWDAAAKGEGTVRYRWTSPLSGKTEPKVSYVQKAGDDICVVGAYSQ